MSETLIVILRYNIYMGLTKTEGFTSNQIQLASLTKALAHPARIAILQFLAKNSCVCGDIVDNLPLSQSTVSQHLKELKNIGLIKGNIEGPSICYCINEEAWKEAQSALNTFFNSFTVENCC